MPLVFLLLGISCRREVSEPVQMGYYYYPADEGSWIIYDVDSVVYDDFTGQTMAYNYQVKELTRNFSVDKKGEKSIRIERFHRADQDDSWEIKDVWQAKILPSRVERTEENIPYIRLTFPVREDAVWDGNAYNTCGLQQYRYLMVNEPFVIDEFHFDSTATVLQMQLYTLISEDFQQEVYAKDVGMVYKKYLRLTKEVDGTIIGGVDYSYTMSDFGKE